jgi:TPR repeat protein
MSYGIVGIVAAEKEAERMAELNELAEAGSGSAAYRLGEIYRLGAWVDTDLALAHQWYQKSAELGNADGMNNLGSMYLNGTGCEKDPALAVDWYRKSEIKGSAQGGCNLAMRHNMSQ